MARTELIASAFEFEQNTIRSTVIDRANPSLRRSSNPDDRAHECQFTGTNNGEVIFGFNLPIRLITEGSIKELKGIKSEILTFFMIWEFFKHAKNFYDIVKPDLNIQHYSSAPKRISVGGRVIIDNPKLLPFIFPAAIHLADMLRDAYRATEGVYVYVSTLRVSSPEDLLSLFERFAVFTPDSNYDFPIEFRRDLARSNLERLVNKIDVFYRSKSRRTSNTTFYTNTYASTYTSYSGGDDDGYIS